MTEPPPAAESAHAADTLVVRAKRDRAALGQLYDIFYPTVLRYCLRRLGDRAVAEDLTSAVFLQIASHISHFGGCTETDFRRWLFRIATNGVHAHWRQCRRRNALWHQAAASGRLAGPAAGGDPSDTAQAALDWPAIQQALLELNEREQSIVSLRFFAGCSHDEIAAIVGASAAAVRTSLSRSLARLRVRLQPADVRQAPG